MCHFEKTIVLALVPAGTSAPSPAPALGPVSSPPFDLGRTALVRPLRLPEGVRLRLQDIRWEPAGVTPDRLTRPSRGLSSPARDKGGASRPPPPGAAAPAPRGARLLLMYQCFTVRRSRA